MNEQERSHHSSCKMFAKKTRNYGLAMQGPRFGPAALPAAQVFAASQWLTFRSAGRAPAKNAGLKVGATLAWPRRQNHGGVEKPQGWRASLALHFSSLNHLHYVTTRTGFRIQEGRDQIPG